MRRVLGSPQRSLSWFPLRNGAVELGGAALEGGDHAAYGFVEQDLDGGLQQPRLELEVDEELDVAAIGMRVEDPVAFQPLERTVGVDRVDARAVGIVGHQRDARGEALAE